MKNFAEYMSKDWQTYPKFRHNLWTTFESEPDKTYLTVSHSRFTVPFQEAQQFLRIRSHCTGHNTVEQIAQKGGLGLEKTKSILSSLREAGIFRASYKPFAELTEEEVREVLFSAARIWSEQLAETNIAVDLRSGILPRNVLHGWLLETYHYIRCFPDAVAHAARYAQGELRTVLEQYAEEERGHESFILRVLEGLGFRKAEVESSIPLTSTRLIDFLMKEMFQMFPAAALLVAAVVEADELEEPEADGFREDIARHYGVDPEVLLPLQKHMMVDSQLGHALLARKHAHLIVLPDEQTLHGTVNKLHDLKHAFDVQKLEIKEYYARVGNYIPRQAVDFFAI